MLTPDLGNLLFELSGGVFLSMNVYRLYKDKRVLGVSWVPAAFYTSWGLYNFYYYAVLGQWLSWWGGWLTTGANLVWLSMYFYYRRKRT